MEVEVGEEEEREKEREEKQMHPEYFLSWMPILIQSQS
jgi:hypothetical protein